MDNKSYISFTIRNAEMGCASTITVEQRRVLPLPPQTVNSFIDKFPAIILQKIKEKFQKAADKETKEVNRHAFLKLFSTACMSEEGLLRLFEFFNDHRKDNLRFRRFMSKYATITKCQPSFLFKIFFQIYKQTIDQSSMSQDGYYHCLSILNEYCHDQPVASSAILHQEDFLRLLEETHFDVELFQKKMTITTEDDIPFHAISQQLHECDFNDLETGQWYYLLSNAWYNRWSFYYQEANPSFDKAHIKSTKLLAPLDQHKMTNKRRKNSSQNRKLNSSTVLRTSQMGNSLIQQPHTIDFEDIEGEFRGELKEKIKTSEEVKIITANLWNLLCTLHPPEQSFKRKAIDEENIEYYPKTVFYSQANTKGAYIIESFMIKHLSITDKVATLFEKDIKDSELFGVFTKNFEQKNWREIELTKKGSDISLDPRFFVVFAQNRQSFIKENFRSEVNSKTLDLGDKVFSYFPFIKKVTEAHIIGKEKEDQFKLHFKGYSYRYQFEVNREDITVEDDKQTQIQMSSKKRHETLIRGINNIGNTCFMNSIIQCLVATPVLDRFLQEFPFDEKKTPIGYGLSQIAHSLFENQKPTPHQFKKLIDVHMPLFSGYDQHDAQQFLNLLLDTISEELPEKPTVIDYLFGGKARSKLTCLSCSAIKNIDEKMYILSLPLPQAEFNYYSIIIVPITSYCIKKIIFKLHRQATVRDYVAAFEERSGQSHKDFNFCESNNSSLKKIKNELTSPSYQSKKVTDIGIVPNISLVAYEKVSQRVYFQLLKEKSFEEFKDFQLLSETFWTVCKISTKQIENNDKAIVEYINQENELERTKIDKTQLSSNIAKLGTQTNEPSYKKIILRKYNSALKKLEHFGIQFLIGIPKWASYQDIMTLVEKYIGNLKSKDAKPSSLKESGDYIIRLLDPVKVRCIFCLKDNNYFGIKESDLEPCCSSFDKDVPLAWAYKHRSYWIYVDWINFSACNSSFCSYIDIDPLSKKVEQSRQEEFINLDQCIRLHNQNQKVEMECDKCKGNYQHLEHQIGSMPNILIVHMKEFRYTAQGHLIKLDLRLKWQQFLDSSKYAFTPQGKLYELFALVRHSGNSQSGHYTCMAKRKHPFENKKVWVNFDDDLTDIVKQQQQFIDDAYLLFYKKVDMPTSSLVIYSDLKQK